MPGMRYFLLTQVMTKYVQLCFASDECNSESPQNSSSDKENHLPRSEHEADVENTKLPEQLQPIKQSKPEGISTACYSKSWF